MVKIHTLHCLIGTDKMSCKHSIHGIYYVRQLVCGPTPKLAGWQGSLVRKKIRTPGVSCEKGSVGPNEKSSGNGIFVLVVTRRSKKGSPQTPPEISP